MIAARVLLWTIHTAPLLYAAAGDSQLRGTSTFQHLIPDIPVHFHEKVHHLLKSKLPSIVPRSVLQQSDSRVHIEKGFDVSLAPAPAVAGGAPAADQPNLPAGSISANQQKVESLIADKLGKEYKANMRPIPDTSVFDGTHKIKIFMGLSFRKLLEVDQIKQTMSMVVWLRVMWPDYRLKYSASQYFKDMPMYSEKPWNSSTDFVPISQDAVWVPDLSVFNAVQGPHRIYEQGDKPRVFWYDERKLADEGYNMILVSPQIIQVQCPMKLADFPFDVQTCEMQFGDWSAADRYFDIGTIDEKAHSSPQFESQNTEFIIKPLPVQRKSLSEDYLVTDQGIPVVSYSVRLERRPHFYLLMIVLPLFLLVLLGQGLYWMDLEKERLSTGITVILAVMAVGFLTEPMLPKTPEILWIESFQVGCYVLTCLPMFFSVLLDYTKTHNVLSEDAADKVDAVARVAHPVSVILFYLIMFGVPGLSGNVRDRDYFAVPEIALFSAFNFMVFAMFFVSGFMRLPCFKDVVQKTTTRLQSNLS